MRRASGWIIATCGVIAACSSSTTSAPTEQSGSTAATSLSVAPMDAEERPSPMRYRSHPRGVLPGAAKVAARRESPFAAPAPEPLLTYRNGPMLQSVDVHAVYWGPNVTPPAGADLPTYLTKLTSNAPYFQMLSEYNVTNPAALTIGSGTFAGLYIDVDAPIPSNNLITDEMVQAEVSRLIDEGHVTRTDNSLFAFFFPAGVAVDQGGGTLSCQVFCGYHGSFTRNAANVYYAILPDFSTDCATGCGATPLDGLYLTLSHEVVEAVTDSDVGQNNLAWYDDVNGEIGDICGGYAGTASSETVQLQWSNEAHGCRDHKGTGLDTITVSPAARTVVAGSSTTFSLALSGNAGAADLAITGLPSVFSSPAADGGVGAPGFFPASITTGGSAKATLDVSATARSTDYTFAAQATDATGVVHYAQPTIHVVGAAPAITSFTPATGPTTGGTAVTVTGTNFGVGSSATVGGVLAQGTYVGGTGGTSFTLTTPSHAVGPATIVITNLNDVGHPASSLTPFVYTAGAGPTVTKVAPNAGPVAGGQFVTVTGTNFGSNATVTIGGSLVPAVDESFVDSKTIQIATPAHVAGAVDVVVTNGDAQAGKLTGGYTYGGAAAPQIDSLSVSQGPTAGGTYVTIYGNTFGSPPIVKFGGTKGVVMTISGSFVGVVSPPHAAGTVPVELTNPDSQVATSPTEFTYVAPLADAGVDSGGAEGGIVTDGGNGTEGGTVVDASTNDSGSIDAGSNDAASADGGSDSGSTPTDSGPASGNDSGSTPGNDSGSLPGDDAGSTPNPSDAAADAQSSGGGGGGGCGCAVPGEQHGTNVLSLLAFGAVVIVTGRRRARRRS